MEICSLIFTLQLACIVSTCKYDTDNINSTVLETLDKVVNLPCKEFVNTQFDITKYGPSSFCRYFLSRKLNDFFMFNSVLFYLTSTY